MTIDDIAAELGVSKTTVSRAITGNGRIASETRERIHQYMAEHDFQPNAIAQNLAKLQSMNVAFTVPFGREFTEIPFFLKCLSGVSRAAAMSSYDVVVAENETEQIQRVVGNRKVDGVLVSRNTADPSMLRRLSESQLPFVLIGTTQLPGVTQIDYDNRAACREFTSRLLTLWPGKPGLIVGEQAYVVNRNRARGFLDAVTASESGFSDEGGMVWEASDERSILEAFEKMYAKGTRSFFCADDVICTYLLHYLHGERKEGVKTASFYNSRHLEVFHPDVPVIDLDAETLGFRACKLLLRKIAGEKVPESTMLVHSVRLNKAEQAG